MHRQFKTSRGGREERNGQGQRRSFQGICLERVTHDNMCAVIWE